ncbi:lysophospholipid acyltransferase family protein [Roseomonas sp. NAR14]|uniref:Lysophospholipid acyltransferase family protein n=1 Tax=Roseomonas acroporae TaxID=2937791 RepID=A0A9X1Y960_9PROT|nr:lysophospholipid acyltransferase family protein [Roseomonas acroporae]MCK8786424.1 lysophospholipid acyltransferase family protein [Roseomonas acroporae]
MLKRLLRHPTTQAALARTLGSYLAFVYRTTRWTLEGGEHIRPFMAEGRPIIAAFWHESLPMMPLVWRFGRQTAPQGPAARGERQAHVLVSRHRDGRLIGDIVSRFDLVMVHASSSRGGTTALRVLARLLAKGDAVAITPDGPRGPRRQAAPGVAQLAAFTGVPVLPCAGASTRLRRLGSWDRMALPLPFGRGVIHLGPPIAVPRDGAATALPAIVAGLNAACDAAEAWAAARGGAPVEVPA